MSEIKAEQSDPEARLFLCCRLGFDNPSSWCALWTEIKLREFLKDGCAAPYLPNGSFSKLRVEIHSDDESDCRCYVWGEDQPGVDHDDFGGSTGLYVEIDGVVILNSLTTNDEGDSDE